MVLTGVIAKQGLPLKEYSFLSGQEIFVLLFDLKIHYRILRMLPLDHILIQFNSVHAFPLCLKLQFNVILQCVFVALKSCLLFKFLGVKLILISNWLYYCVYWGTLLSESFGVFTSRQCVLGMRKL
jgi:hypothetical protein